MKKLKYSLAIGALLLGVAFLGVRPVHAEDATQTTEQSAESATDSSSSEAVSSGEQASNETAASEETTGNETASSEETTGNETAASEEASSDETTAAKAATTAAKTQTVTISSENTNLKRWLSICKSIGKNLDKNFRYSNHTPIHSYAKACKSRRKRANCALYVSFCLQKYGVLSGGKRFYTRKSGKIKKNFKSWGSKVKVIKVNKRIGKANLKPGDIVCWKGIGHTNIYAGKNSKGQYTFYDAGRRSTRKGHSGSKFKNVEYARSLSFLKGKKISYIIRIKNL